MGSRKAKLNLSGKWSFGKKGGEHEEVKECVGSTVDPLTSWTSFYKELGFFKVL